MLLVYTQIKVYIFDSRINKYHFKSLILFKRYAPIRSNLPNPCSKIFAPGKRSALSSNIYGIITLGTKHVNPPQHTCFMLAGFITIFLSYSGTELAKRAIAPVTTGDATLVPDKALHPPLILDPCTLWPYANTSGLALPYPVN